MLFLGGLLCGKRQTMLDSVMSFQINAVSLEEPGEWRLLLLNFLSNQVSEHCATFGD
jgi:hypothetical protein